MTNEQKQIVYYGKIKNGNDTIYIAITEKGLCFIGSPNGGISELEAWIAEKRPDVTLIENEEKISRYGNQLLDYLHGNRRSFDLPIDLKGTPFQESIWHELQNIPYGKTTTYSDVANRIGKPKAVRAVGAAIGANPVLMVVPCHRVVAKNGNLTGFRGGMAMKEKLLMLENNNE